ncbi:cysteine--tRNA ligase [Gammaproteobacteria bacterium LSUCC0057]|uniref:Cysteine--tRNA ligase n=1 Tax=Gammaproteobacteria bacterium LSUCC0057 TaxID=2559237 RepID=A0A4Y8UKR2_9GAMM|nr:cysteine--tRNA ligase [Gammaproteobacteria bacterium LSUCC0057]
MESVLQLYNTASRSKQPFVPQSAERVTMYVCGPTVYNRVHIGNARPAVIFDTLYRLLKQRHGRVDYARNITDIDDKIIQAAAANNESTAALTARYTQAYFDDMAALNNLPPPIVPLATDHLAEMIALVAQLIDSGHAYVAQSHVLFDVESMANYGALSGRSLDEMLAGARVEVASYKRHPGDFVLWKPSSAEQPGWQSPWGRGRPGWHLECSAMIEKHLGTTIDIHGGGQDLIFPHHENEIAQSCCAHGGQPLANFWLHNGFINIDGEKMSKSLGNFKTVEELLTLYRGEVLRYALLAAHYRSEANFSGDLLEQAQSSLDSLYTALRSAADVPAQPFAVAASAGYAALCDDLNTPAALGELHRLARLLNSCADDAKPAAKGELLAVAELLGLLDCDPEQWFTAARFEGAISAEQIEALIAERGAAKQAREFARADQIRQQLLDAGVVLEDSRTGTSWRRE